VPSPGPTLSTGLGKLTYVRLLCIVINPRLQQESNFVGYDTFVGVLLFSEVVQMFVLGPRLILGLREYHAKLVDDSDEGTAMTSMAFHEHVHISTGGGV
jgi:hypothetical protein